MMSHFVRLVAFYTRKSFAANVAAKDPVGRYAVVAFAVSLQPFGARKNATTYVAMISVHLLFAL